MNINHSKTFGFGSAKLIGDVIPYFFSDVELPSMPEFLNIKENNSMINDQILMQTQSRCIPKKDDKSYFVVKKGLKNLYII